MAYKSVNATDAKRINLPTISRNAVQCVEPRLRIQSCTNEAGTPMLKDKFQPSARRRYDANYENFQSELYSSIRRQAYGEDIGQNSWLTADEHDKFLEWLELSTGKRLLDVACGAGGPAIRAAEKHDCTVVGIDLHEKAIAAANGAVTSRGLRRAATFQQGNVGESIPFADGYFDAIICIDAINHIPGRPLVFSEWARLLKPSGKVLFTDPVTVTGALTDSELRIRSLGGFYLFVPEGYNERLLAERGLRLLRRENVTLNMAEVAERRWKARDTRKNELCEVEGPEGFREQQEFLATAAKIASENRLSRFVFLAEKCG